MNQQDFSGRDMISYDFSYSDMKNNKFNGTNLSSCCFQGTNLENAQMCGANLIHAKLCGSQLLNAKLNGADLSGADLTGANLMGADLRQSNLKNANLTNSNLSGARVQGVHFEESSGLTEDIKRELRKRGAIIQNPPPNIQDIRWLMQHIVVPIAIACIGSGGIVGIYNLSKQYCLQTKPTRTANPIQKSC